MIKRNITNSLVVMVIEKNGPTTAAEIYTSIQMNSPGKLESDKIRGFRSFARLIPTFKELEKMPHTYPSKYSLKKDI